MRKFWNFTTSPSPSNNNDGENILRIDGYIAETSWFEDEVC